MKYLVFLCFCLVTFTVKAQFFYWPFPPTKADYVLNETAKVKICNEYRFISSEKQLTRILEYGAAGLPVVLYRKDINENGEAVNVSETSYKYLNMRLVQTTSKEEEDGYKVVYDYDITGKLLRKTVIHIDPPTYTYVHDKSGKPIKATIKVTMPDEQGKAVELPQGRYNYEYDARGRLVRETNFSQHDEKLFSVKWEYNNKNQVVKVIGLDADDQPMYEQVLEYGKNGLLAKRTENRPDEEDSIIFMYEYCTDCRQSWMR